jgi:hypothetical protein
MITDVWFMKDINAAVKKIAAISTSPLYYYEFSFDGPFGIIKRIWGAETLPGKFAFVENTRQKEGLGILKCIPEAGFLCQPSSPPLSTSQAKNGTGTL